MDSDRINRWLTLGANLGVLVGIIFLAVEIRQNSELARIQLTDERMTTWQQGELVVLGDSIAHVWEKSVLDPASLSLAETRMLDAYLAFQLTNATRILHLETDGLMVPGATKRYLEGNMPFFFDTEFARAWWEIEGRTWEQELVEIAEPVIADVTKDQSVIKLRKIRALAAERVGDTQ